MKLGKFPAKVDRRTLLFRDVVPSLPAPIDLIDWSHGISDFGMMGNDQHGDCTCAALGHAEQTITANCPEFSELTPSDKQVLTLYVGAGGWDPAKPWTDRGAYAIDVLNYVRKQGLFGIDSLLGYVQVNPEDKWHVKQAISYFGGLYVGIQLPDSVVKDDLSEQSWNLTGKIVPDPYNGHMVWVCGYNATGPVCITWAKLKQMSWSFFETCCDEAYAILFKNWLGQYGNLSVAAQALENALQGIAA